MPAAPTQRYEQAKAAVVRFMAFQRATSLIVGPNSWEQCTRRMRKGHLSLEGIFDLRHVTPFGPIIPPTRAESRKSLSFPYSMLCRHSRLLCSPLDNEIIMLWQSAPGKKNTIHTLFFNSPHGSLYILGPARTTRLLIDHPRVLTFEQFFPMVQAHDHSNPFHTIDSVPMVSSQRRHSPTENPTFSWWSVTITSISLRF